MASIIIFSTMWGFVLKEWSGCRFAVKRTVWLGVLLLVVATIVIGAGNRLNGS
jgi:L-rhamnose-H+ transport protein